MGKNVKSNFTPMNGDVAKAIMDPQTTKALGGVVVVDHYVKTGKELANDIQELADNSKGNVILGEFGAPIYDIHGKFNEKEQAEWIKESLEELTRLKVLKGVNYWVSHGGSTQIWNDQGKPKAAVEVLTAYYKPKTISGSIYNELNEPISNAEIVYNTMYLSSDKEGQFIIKDNEIDGKATIFANGYKQKNILVNAENTHVKVILEKVSENPWFKFRKFLINL